MARPAGFVGVEERLAGRSKKGGDLEWLAAVIDFEVFRPELEHAAPAAPPPLRRSALCRPQG